MLSLPPKNPHNKQKLHTTMTTRKIRHKYTPDNPLNYGKKSRICTDFFYELII